MKTITKFIYAAFAVVIVAIGTITANGTPGDIVVTINGGNGGNGYIYTYAGGQPPPLPYPFGNYLRGVAFDNVGNLFVVNHATFLNTPTVWKFAPNGISTFATPSPNFGVEGLATDAANNVFVVANDGNTPSTGVTIFKITPDGTLSTFGSIPYPGQGWGAVCDSANNLFVADGSDQIIYKFTPDGTRSIFVGPSAFTNIQGPVGLAFDRFGNLFVSTEGANFLPPYDVIYKFMPDGTESTFATGINNPRGLAFDRRGNLFVTLLVEHGPNGEILKFTPDGNMTVFSSGIGCQSVCGPEWLAIQPLTPRPRPSPHPRPILSP